MMPLRRIAFLAFAAALAALAPVRAQTGGDLTFTGVGSMGGGGAYGPLTPPTFTPQPSTNFTYSNSGGFVNNALEMNNNTAGAGYGPSPANNSLFWYVEGQVDPGLYSSSAASGAPYMLGGGSGSVGLSSQAFGQPTLETQVHNDGFNWLWFQSASLTLYCKSNLGRRDVCRL